MHSKDHAYSRAEKEKIARTAKRSIRSECTLILTAGFALVMVLTFALAHRTFLPFALLTGLPPLLAWVIVSLGVAVFWAWLHFIWFQPAIVKSRALGAALQDAYEEARRRENMEKYRKMRRDD